MTGESSAGSARRGWVIPAALVVLVVVGVAAWLTVPGWFDDDSLGPDDFGQDPNEVVTAFWERTGRETLSGWRELSAAISTNVAIGRDCLPEEEFKPDACPEIADRLARNAEDVRRVTTRLETAEAPSRTTASAWAEQMIAAWGQLESDLTILSEIAARGFASSEWLPAYAAYAEHAELFTDAEMRLAAMLAEVAVDSRSVDGG